QGEGGEPNPDVVAALIQLGWNETTATRAVIAVESSGEGGAGLSVPELLRASLRWLGGGHRD
ncbi:MAG: Holliday junction branch migration protein RuvA, partial [Actinomyces sp.]